MPSVRRTDQTENGKEGTFPQLLELPSMQGRARLAQRHQRLTSKANSGVQDLTAIAPTTCRDLKKAYSDLVTIGFSSKKW